VNKKAKKEINGTVVFACITLIAVLLFVTVNTAVLSSMINGLTEEASSMKLELDDVEALYKKFLGARTYLSITVNHEDIESVEEEFAELLGALPANDVESAAIAKSRLVSALTHLGRLSGFNLDSII